MTSAIPGHHNDGERDEPTSQRDLHALIDSIFDGDASADDASKLHRLADDDPRAIDEFARMRRVVDAFREPVETPDATDAVLRRVHGQRQWLPQRLRKTVTLSRVCVAASLVLAAGVIAFIDRHAPQAKLVQQAEPIARLAEPLSETTSRSTEQLASAIREATRIEATRVESLADAQPVTAVDVVRELRLSAAEPAAAMRLRASLKTPTADMRGYAGNFARSDSSSPQLAAAQLVNWASSTGDALLAAFDSDSLRSLSDDVRNWPRTTSLSAKPGADAGELDAVAGPMQSAPTLGSWIRGLVPPPPVDEQANEPTDPTIVPSHLLESSGTLP
ncbi:MAG: hypothetical protein AAF747_03060 [Planctomycetota bacterium]